MLIKLFNISFSWHGSLIRKWRPGKQLSLSIFKLGLMCNGKSWRIMTEQKIKGGVWAKGSKVGKLSEAGSPRPLYASQNGGFSFPVGVGRRLSGGKGGGGNDLLQRKFRESFLYLSFLKILQCTIFKMARYHMWDTLSWTSSLLNTFLA